MRVDHLLSWRGLAKFEPRVQMAEIVEGVRDNAKARFGLKFVSKGEEVAEHAVKEVEAESETVRALKVFDESEGEVDAKQFFIRANQGHTIKSVGEEGLMQPIILPTATNDGKDVEALPTTVVHGTFYASWEAISTEGLLRSMGRNHVHFSSGPPVETARGDSTTQDDTQEAQQQTQKPKSSKLAQMMANANVKSGMRPDAEVLIYVDLEKALEAGMKWWHSENGVLLSEGLSVGGDALVSSTNSNTSETPQSTEAPSQATEVPDEGMSGKGKSKATNKENRGGQQSTLSGIGTEFWTEVVEVKEGLGTLWKDGELVQDLPDRLKGRALPMGKARRGGRDGGGGGGGRGRGRGGGRGGQRLQDGRGEDE